MRAGCEPLARQVLPKGGVWLACHGAWSNTRLRRLPHTGLEPWHPRATLVARLHRPPNAGARTNTNTRRHLHVVPSTGGRPTPLGANSFRSDKGSLVPSPSPPRWTPTCPATVSPAVWRPAGVGWSPLAPWRPHDGLGWPHLFPPIG